MLMMRIIKHISLVVSMLGIFARCTEIYVPDINSSTKALVVEGLITDGSGPFTVKLTEAVSFTADSALNARYVSGAKVNVSDSLNNISQLIETGRGIYSLPTSFKANVGNSYKLQIETIDGNIFESSFEKLLPPQTYDNIQGVFSSEKYIDKSNNTRIVNGADMRVDLFGSVPATEKTPSCRFKSDITVQYTFTYNMPDTTDWHWFVYGWESFDLNSTENITDEKTVDGSAVIRNHSLGFAPVGTLSYGYNVPENTIVTYYLRINQYTLNNRAFNYYKAANNQLAATGKIFDPVTSQLYGNMKCINNPSKVVLGLFEVSSVTHSAYVIDVVAASKKVYVFKAPYTPFPGIGLFRYKVWDANPRNKPVGNPDYVEIPFTNWWYHNEK
jgi:hypothetical protein